jgi:hypothetical protein
MDAFFLHSIFFVRVCVCAFNVSQFHSFTHIMSSSSHNGACDCDKCKTIRMKSKALALVQSRMSSSSSSQIMSLVRMLKSSEKDHEETIRKTNGKATRKESVQSLLRKSTSSSKSGIDSWVFFPQDFKSFLLTGCVPKIEVSSRTAATLTSPVFVLGCGRSGTTILSSILGHIPGAVFLNEPRVLWINALEHFDIWSTLSDRRKGTLRFDSEDISEKSASFLRNMHRDVLAAAAAATTKTFILEKFPEHVFKISALLRIFPTAKFVHIIRDPHDVAISIGSFERYAWFGATDRKWKEICKIASSILPADMIRNCASNSKRRGLIEWTVAMHTIESDVASIWQKESSKQFLELKYEDLVRNPVRTTRNVSRFITNECSKDAEVFALSNIKNQSTKKRDADIVKMIQTNKFIRDIAIRKGYDKYN